MLFSEMHEKYSKPLNLKNATQYEFVVSVKAEMWRKHLF